MKWFTEPSGKFVIQIPLDWRYMNVAMGNREESPYCFEQYENQDIAFQISCYSESEQPLNNSIKVQRSNTNNLGFVELRREFEECEMYIWFATVEKYSFIIKFIFGLGMGENKEIVKEVSRIKQVLSTLELISEERRARALSMDRYDKFMASLAASFDLKYKAVKSESYLEFSLITANQIDAYLRLCIVMYQQLEDQTNELNSKLIYQGESDKPIMEREIYNKAESLGIIDKSLFHELEDLYKERNKMVHRYIISDFKTRDLLQIAYRYELANEKVRLLLRDIEDLQLDQKIGVCVNKKSPREYEYDDIKRMHSQINDKHLLEEFEREIKVTNTMQR